MKTKNAIILHGTGNKPTMYWFPYVARELRQRGFNVWAPQLPNAAKPNLADWLPFVLKQGKFSSETVIIGHSAGSQLILSILEKIPVTVKQAILVSGYAKPLPKTAGHKNGTSRFQWQKIKKRVRDITFINSDNDPWGYDDKQGRIMFEHLGGTLIIKHEGHMGSTTYKQPYKKFPLILKLVSD